MYMCNIPEFNNPRKMLRPTPEDISKNRLARSKIMKIDLSERNIMEKISKYVELRNPFYLPPLKRVFTLSKKKSNKNSNMGQRIPKPEPFIMSEPHTICDIDHSFYKIIEGRPLRRSNDIKVYMTNIRDITLFRANAAYLKDQILQLDASFAFENAEYKAIRNFYTKCQDSFIQFMKESFSDAKDIQSQALEKRQQLDMITDQLEALSFQYVALRNKVENLMVIFEILSNYRRFLNYFSPESWIFKNKQDFVEHDSFYGKVIGEVKMSRVSIHKYKSSMSELKSVTPMLYFKKPEDLIHVFKNISKQCLSYTNLGVFSSSITKSVITSRDNLKVKVKEEINEMEYLIETCKGYVKYMEGKEQDFKSKFEKILRNDFKTLFSSFEVSKLYTCLQFTNTQVFRGPEDPKDSLASLALLLEQEYMDLCMALDKLNLEVVKKATNEFFTEDIKMLKRAHHAQRTLRECDILSKAMYASFEPPRRTRVIRK